MIRKFVILLLVLALAWLAHGWWTVRQFEGTISHDEYYLLVPTHLDFLSIALADQWIMPRFGIKASHAFFTIPFWLATLSLGAYPALTFIRGPVQRFRRRRRGLCVRCGYNLAGNTSGVCSECGCAFEFRFERADKET